MISIRATAVTSVSLLTILKDGKKHMARCPELDLVTEMDTQEEALKAMVEIEE